MWIVRHMFSGSDVIVFALEFSNSLALALGTTINQALNELYHSCFCCRHLPAPNALVLVSSPVSAPLLASGRAPSLDMLLLLLLVTWVLISLTAATLALYWRLFSTAGQPHVLRLGGGFLVVPHPHPSRPNFRIHRLFIITCFYCYLHSLGVYFACSEQLGSC